MISELKDNEVFVFGSNAHGEHYGGAAKQAHEQFGAEWGIREGLTGKCYAFPTLKRDFTRYSPSAMQGHRNTFYWTARQNPDKVFLLTPVGTGIAGFDYAYIEELFKDLPPNVKKVGWR